MIKFNFNIKKSTQAAALFLKLNNHELNYMKLIKLLYILDRSAITKWNEPVTGDSYYSLKHGPIVSNVMNYITAPAFPNINDYWHDSIEKSSSDPYSVKLINDPGIDELSEREIEKIKEIHEEFIDFDQWELREYCHDYLPEWKEPGETSIPITVEDICHAVGKSKKEIEAIEDEAEFIRNMQKTIGACS